jgi:hypothetical protein
MGSLNISGYIYALKRYDFVTQVVLEVERAHSVPISWNTLDSPILVPEIFYVQRSNLARRMGIFLFQSLHKLTAFYFLFLLNMFFQVKLAESC